METITKYLELVSMVGTVFTIIIIPAGYYLMKRVIASVTEKNWRHIDIELSSLKDWVQSQVQFNDASMKEMSARTQKLEIEMHVLSERNRSLGDRIELLAGSVEKLSDRIDKQTDIYIKLLEKRL